MITKHATEKAIIQIKSVIWSWYNIIVHTSDLETPPLGKYKPYYDMCIQYTFTRYYNND